MACGRGREGGKGEGCGGMNMDMDMVEGRGGEVKLSRLVRIPGHEEPIPGLVLSDCTVYSPSQLQGIPS